MKSPFRVAFALWLSPDFSQVLAGRVKPPHINHSKVDFEVLAKLLATTFHYGPPVTIRVPNDSIDQVTQHVRNGRSHRGTIRCEDFGAAMLQCAKKQTGTVIDVIAAWQPLHELKDRNFAPPPVLLPFVVEAVDFEDAMIWQASAQTCLGLPFLSPQLQAMEGEAHGVQTEGTLPEATKTGLATIFSCQYKTFSLLDRMAMDMPPNEYRANRL